MTVEAAVRARLLEETAITDLVDDRISPHTRDQDPAAVPAITYESPGIEEIRDLDGPTGSGRLALQIDAWAATPDAAKTLALAVAAALRTNAGEGIRAAFRQTMTGPVQDPEVPVWRVRSLYDVHYSAAVAA